MSVPVRGYPYTPREATSALLLYGCGEVGGENDGRFIAEDGIEHVTVVDIDPVRIENMRQRYPNWEYVCADALRYASDANRRGARFDVVSADPYTNSAGEAYAAITPILIPLARMMLVVGVQVGNVEHARRQGAEIITRNAAWSWAVWS